MLSVRSQRGQSLIEAIVALALFLVVMSGTVIVSARYLDTTVRANDLKEVQVAAKEGMEAVQSIAYSSWADMVDGQYGLDDGPGSWQFQPSSDLVKNRYTRTVTISPVERDMYCQIVDSGGIDDPDTKLVTTTLAWGPTALPQVRSFVQYFSNWKAPASCPSPVYYFAIHGNSNVSLVNTNGTINGDINAGGTVDPDIMTINGDIYEYSPIPIPLVDFAAYLNIADHVVNGNKKFDTGSYSGIWFVTGNVNMKGSVSFNNGTLIALGNIDFGNVGSASFSPSGAYPALVAGGNINANNASSASINGVAFSNGNIVINSAGSISVYGSLIADGNVEIKNSGSVTVTYDSSLPENPPPYFD